MSWSIIVRNRRHVHLDIKPVGAPVFRQVRFAAGRDLDSRKPLSRILPAGVEAMLTLKIRQPSHEFTFGVGMTFVSYSLVLTPVV
jgi:hypothetical protein